MSSLSIGFLAFAVILVLIAFRVPVALALIMVAVVGLAQVTSWDVAMTIVRIAPYEFAANWELSAVPMFILMGSIAFRSGMTSSLFTAARLWLGRLPGGLAVATNFSAAGFSAASGSSLATTVAIGRVTLPEMLKYGYNPGLAAGVVACSGTLGALIPPSIIMIIYGIFSGVSVSALFLAGVIPGLLSAFVYAAMIIVRCWLDPSLAPRVEERVSWGEKFRSLMPVWPLPMLVIAIVGAIYTGVATPTEAGALGALLAAIVAIVKGQMNLAVFRQACMETLLTTATLFFVGVGAILLTRFVAFTGMPLFLAGIATEWLSDPLLLILIIAAIYVMLGFFLDPFGIMLLTLPVLLPVLQAANLDLIWFGILLVKFIEIGLITPPLGLNVMAAKSIVPQIPLTTIFRGTGWFLVCEFLILAALIMFPEIVLFLPNSVR